MNRTTWLQDRRMAKFYDVLSRWKARELSAQEAGEILGCSERQFRRYCRRYEEGWIQTEFHLPMFGFAHRCMFGVQPDLDSVLGRPLQPCNRALFSPLPVPITLLAHACTLAS